MRFKQQKEMNEEGKKGARGSVGGRNKQKQPVARIYSSAEWRSREVEKLRLLWFP